MPSDRQTYRPVQVWGHKCGGNAALGSELGLMLTFYVAAAEGRFFNLLPTAGCLECSRCLLLVLLLLLPLLP